jgi:hypothetical protein
MEYSIRDELAGEEFSDFSRVGAEAVARRDYPPPGNSRSVLGRPKSQTIAAAHVPPPRCLLPADRDGQLGRSFPG